MIVVHLSVYNCGAKRNRKSELSGGVVVGKSELLVRRSAARAKTVALTMCVVS